MAALGLRREWRCEHTRWRWGNTRKGISVRIAGVFGPGRATNLVTGFK